jgi:hypothetical protein
MINREQGHIRKTNERYNDRVIEENNISCRAESCIAACSPFFGYFLYDSQKMLKKYPPGPATCEEGKTELAVVGLISGKNNWTQPIKPKFATLKSQRQRKWYPLCTREKEI